MNALDLVRRLHEHRRWVNRSLLAAAQELSPAQLKQPCAIGQGSIWKSLLHLYAAEYVWLAALLGNEAPLCPGDAPDMLPGNQQGERAIESLGELAEEWTALEMRWRELLDGLTAKDLQRPVAKQSTSSAAGKVHSTRASDVLLHVCTHAQYTTAQVVNILRQLGVDDLPDAMLISLARKQADPAQFS